MTAIFSHVEYYVMQPEVKDLEVEKAVSDAIRLGLPAICVPPYWVKKASRDTHPAGITLSTAVGFPFGYQRTEAKVSEAELAFADGAQEIVLTINLSALKSERWNWIKAEIARFAKLVHEREKLLTVLTHMDRLTSQEAIQLCKNAADAGADYLQTTTGQLHGAGDAVHSVSFIRQALPPAVGLKVYQSRLIADEAEALLKEGADKICTPDLSGIPVHLPEEKK